MTELKKKNDLDIFLNALVDYKKTKDLKKLVINAMHFRDINKDVAFYLLSKALHKSDDIDRELSIICFYIDKLDVGLIACDKLSMKGDYHGLDNLKWYAPILETSKPVFIKYDNLKKDWNIGNTSLFVKKDKLYAISRIVNYTIGKNNEYIYKEGYIITENIVTVFDKDLNQLSTKVVKTPDRYLKDKIIKGMEDIRCILHDDNIHISYSYCENGCSKIKMDRAILKEQEDKYIVDNIQQISDPGSKWEKNWIPFIKNDKVAYIYSHEPMTYIVDKEKIVDNISLPFRGSCGPVRVGDNYISLIHFVTFNKIRFYYHRFVKYDTNMKPVAYSYPFTFTRTQIEYSTGITLGFCNDIIISYSVMDRNARIVRISIENLEKMFVNFI